VNSGGRYGAICGDGMREVVRRSDGGPRWCFRCRKVRAFVFRVMSPGRMSYYGPVPSIRCGTCELLDGDLFPGRFREWEE